MIYVNKSAEMKTQPSDSVDHKFRNLYLLFYPVQLVLLITLPIYLPLPMQTLEASLIRHQPLEPKEHTCVVFQTLRTPQNCQIKQNIYYEAEAVSDIESKARDLANKVSSI